MATDGQDFAIWHFIGKVQEVKTKRQQKQKQKKYQILLRYWPSNDLEINHFSMVFLTLFHIVYGLLCDVLCQKILSLPEVELNLVEEIDEGNCLYVTTENIYFLLGCEIFTRIFSVF